jgi:hypothetical protein
MIRDVRQGFCVYDGGSVVQGFDVLEEALQPT